MTRQHNNKVTWRKAIFSAIESFKDYKLESVKEYKNSVPQNPLSDPQAAEFLEAVKEDNYHEVEQLLFNSPKLVYEFDEIYQTGLHWAAKRGLTNMIYLLIKSGANINIKDVSGRTPLWLS